jgi:hypothetical protein
VPDEAEPNAAVASISDSRLFGGLAIDLNTAAIFPSGTCESFAQACLKSRSSDSYTSEPNDFVAPRPVNITNCGRFVQRRRQHRPARRRRDVPGQPGKVVNGVQQSSSNLNPDLPRRLLHRQHAPGPDIP